MDQLNKINDVFQNVTTSVNAYGNYLTPLEFPYREDLAENIRKADSAIVNQIATSFESYNDIIEDGPRPDESIGDTNKRHVRDFMDKFGLKVNERIFDYITDDLLVEVYSHNHQQLFRSVNFFSLSQYTLPELTFYPWDELFYRSEKDDKVMFQNINRAVDNKIEVMNPNVPSHLLEELKTGRKFKYEMVKLACVFDKLINGEMGYLTLISVSELRGKLKLLH